MNNKINILDNNFRRHAKQLPRCFSILHRRVSVVRVSIRRHREHFRLCPNSMK